MTEREREERGGKGERVGEERGRAKERGGDGGREGGEKDTERETEKEREKREREEKKTDSSLTRYRYLHVSLRKKLSILSSRSLLCTSCIVAYPHLSCDNHMIMVGIHR